MKKYDTRHGGPYDRGAADAYYWRNRNPHKWPDNKGLTKIFDLTPDELEAYEAGYIECEDRKDFGFD